jgi:hypothetical protein
MREVIPYFPCYAENIIADRNYRSMSLLERGLWISIYLECWPNISVPKDPTKMAKILGFSPDEIISITMANIMYFFKEEKGEIISPELNRQREEFKRTREKKSAGGKKGARIKKEMAIGNPEGIPIGRPNGSSCHIKSNHIKSNQLVEKGVMTPEQKAWVDEYENFDDATAQYLKASRG